MALSMRDSRKVTVGGSAALGWVLVLAAVFAPAALAVPASDWSRDEFTQARLISAAEAVGEEAEIVLGLEFRMDPGWKVY